MRANAPKAVSSKGEASKLSNVLKNAGAAGRAGRNNSIDLFNHDLSHWEHVQVDGEWNFKTKLAFQVSFDT